MKLYRVKTIVKEYDGCKDVPFSWFCVDRDQPRPYFELIENYDPGDEFAPCAKVAVDELFTEAEAAALQEYLDREHGGAGITTINEASLPLPKDILGVKAIPVGGGNDTYRLDAETAYNLPFRVQGFFSLVGRELVAGSGVYRHRPLLLSL